MRERDIVVGVFADVQRIDQVVPAVRAIKLMISWDDSSLCNSSDSVVLSPCMSPAVCRVVLVCLPQVKCSVVDTLPTHVYMTKGKTFL